MPTRPAPFRPATGPGSEADRRERAKAYDAKRLAESETRALYSTARWRGLRSGQLRDEPLCRFCLLFDRVTPATICDHAEPHEGKLDLFWCGPFQSLCKTCHDVHKQREEWDRKQLSALLDDRRLPKDLRPSCVPLTIVCGAAGSGKSTYVRTHASPADRIIDLDAIMMQISGLPEHRTGAEWVVQSLEERNRQLRELAHDRRYPAAWFIVAAPNPVDRQTWGRMLGGRVVTMTTPLDECCRRIRSDPTRSGQHERMVNSAISWWSYNTRAYEGVGGSESSKSFG